MDRKIKILVTDLKKQLQDAELNETFKNDASFFTGQLNVLVFCIRRLEKILKETKPLKQPAVSSSLPVIYSEKELDAMCCCEPKYNFSVYDLNGKVHCVHCRMPLLK